MTARTALTALTAVTAVLVGCLPEGAPPWRVDHPIAAAVRVDVARRGPYGPISPRADRLVAEVMPGDRIRITPFLVGPDGPLDLEDVAPAWFYCQATRCFGDVAQPEPPRDCASEPLGPETTCRIGAGPTPTLQLGELTTLGLFGDPPAVYMVAGTGGVSTQRCLERLRLVAQDAETLQECILFIEPLPLGPVWRLLLLAQFLGLPDAIPLSTLPIELLAAEPSLYPEILPFELSITAVDGAVRETIAAPGETVAVAPGEAVTIAAPVDPIDAQLFYQTLLGGDGLPVVQASFEVLGSSWLFTAAAEEPTFVDVQKIRWQVPEDAVGAVHGYYLLSDGRSLEWAWLRFEVSGVPGVSVP